MARPIKHLEASSGILKEFQLLKSAAAQNPSDPLVLEYRRCKLARFPFS